MAQLGETIISFSVVLAAAAGPSSMVAEGAIVEVLLMDMKKKKRKKKKAIDTGQISLDVCAVGLSLFRLFFLSFFSDYLNGQAVDLYQASASEIPCLFGSWS